MVNINGCVCFSPSYLSKRRWKISCFLPRRLWVRWLIQKNDESRLARETFDAFSWHKNLPSLSDSVHKPRSGSLTRIYIKFQTNSLNQIYFGIKKNVKNEVYQSLYFAFGREILSWSETPYFLKGEPCAWRQNVRKNFFSSNSFISGTK